MVGLSFLGSRYCWSDLSLLPWKNCAVENKVERVEGRGHSAPAPGSPPERESRLSSWLLRKGPGCVPLLSQSVCNLP